MKIAKVSMIAMALAAACVVPSAYAQLTPGTYDAVSAAQWDVENAKEVGKRQTVLHRSSQMAATKTVYEVKERVVPVTPKTAFFAEVKFMDMAPTEKTDRAFVIKAPTGPDWYWQEGGK